MIFLQLFKNNYTYKWEVQINGEIVNGVDLIRKITQKESFGLTSPLITLASGAKWEKQNKEQYGCNKDLLSPYDYWQFWRNTDDRDVKKFLNFFTDLMAIKLMLFVKAKKISII